MFDCLQEKITMYIYLHVVDLAAIEQAANYEHLDCIGSLDTLQHIVYCSTVADSGLKYCRRSLAVVFLCDRAAVKVSSQNNSLFSGKTSDNASPSASPIRNVESK